MRSDESKSEKNDFYLIRNDFSVDIWGWLRSFISSLLCFPLTAWVDAAALYAEAVCKDFQCLNGFSWMTLKENNCFISDSTSIINAKCCLPFYICSRQWNSAAHIIEVLTSLNCDGCLRSSSSRWALVRGVRARCGWERSCDSEKERLSLQLDPLVWKACYNCLCCWGLNSELPPGSIYLHGVCFLLKKKKISLLENQLWRRNGDYVNLANNSLFLSNGLFVFNRNKNNYIEKHKERAQLCKYFIILQIFSF